MAGNKKTTAGQAATAAILRHWREAVPNDRLAHLVKDAWRGLSRSLQLRLTRHSVSFGHWTFLRILWERDGLTQRELSELAGVQEPTTFAALKALETLGYVARRRRPDSRKKVYIHLTPRGRALKSRLVPLAEEVNRAAVRGVTPADIATTRRVLLAMIENLAGDETEAARQDRRIPSTRELARVVADARSRNGLLTKSRATAGKSHGAAKPKRSRTLFPSLRGRAQRARGGEGARE